MTQEGFETFRLPTQAIEVDIHLKHSGIWSGKVLAISTQAHILSAEGRLENQGKGACCGKSHQILGVAVDFNSWICSLNRLLHMSKEGKGKKVPH